MHSEGYLRGLFAVNRFQSGRFRANESLSDLLNDIDDEKAELRRSIQSSPNLPEAQNQL